MSDLASITSHIHSWVLFLLWLHPFILSGVISPLISSSIGHLLTWGVPLSVFCLFAFSYCSWGSQGTNPEVVCRSLLQWTTFCQNSPPWSSVLVALHSVAHGFIELDKVVVFVIRLVSFPSLWIQSVCPLMPSLSAYRLIGVSLTLHMEYLFTAASAKRSRCCLSWTWGISLRPLLLTLDVECLLLASSRRHCLLHFENAPILTD